jgi:virginiamycin B lyase
MKGSRMGLPTWMSLLVAVTAAWAAMAPHAARAEQGGWGLPYQIGGGVHATAMTAGPDGDVWFTAAGALAAGGKQIVGKVTMSGEVTEYAVPLAPDAAAIVAGPDGALWFTESTGIGRITTGGEETSYPIAGKTGLSGLAWSPDGELWFSEEAADAIGRMSPGGAVTALPLPRGSEPSDIAVGAEGDMWFTERKGSRIGRVTPAGEVTEFPIPGKTAAPGSIALGADGNLWFTDANSPRVGRITPAGQVEFFPLPTAGGTERIIAGPDSLMWFTSGEEVGAIGTGGAIEWPSCILRECSGPADALTAAADGSLWVSSGIQHCPTLCGGGSEQYLEDFAPGFIGPFQLTIRKVSIGPRLTRLQGNTTSVLLACGPGGDCRGHVRLGFNRYVHGERRFTVMATGAYELGAGEDSMVTLRLRPGSLRQALRASGRYRDAVYVDVRVGEGGDLEAQRYLALGLPRSEGN